MHRECAACSETVVPIGSWWRHAWAWLDRDHKPEPSETPTERRNRERNERLAFYTKGA